MNDFEGQIALVTGAGSGIGEATARKLYGSGAKVFLAVHTEEQVVSLTKALPGTAGKALDVRDAHAVKTLVEEATSIFGGLDFAVNCAGITGPAQTSVADLDVAIWDDVIATDLSGMFYCLKYEIEAMLKAPGQKAIVNMSSANGIVGLAGLPAYTASKHGVIGLTRSAALELAEQGIRVNAVAPGYVETPKVLASGEEVLAMFRAVHPIKRLARPEEVVDLVLFLLSRKSGFATGGVFSLDGGFTAQ